MEFALDVFGCECVYVLDLDEGKLEAFEGFVKKDSASMRFNDIEAEIPDPKNMSCSEIGSEADYVPCLAKSFSFDELPATSEEFADIIRSTIKERNGDQEKKAGDVVEEEGEKEEGLSTTGTKSATTDFENATETSSDAITVVRNEASAIILLTPSTLLRESNHDSGFRCITYQPCLESR